MAFFIPVLAAIPLGASALTEPDLIPPIATGVSVTPYENKAIIRWHTDEKVRSVLFYSASSDVDIRSPGTKSLNFTRRSKGHKAVLKNLIADTTYYAVIRSTDKAGNVSLSDTISFATLPREKAASHDSKAPKIGRIMRAADASTIRLGWTTDEKATARVFYSTQNPVALGETGTRGFADTKLDTKHVLTIPGLVPNTTYYFIVESKDAAGNVERSKEIAQTTSPQSENMALSYYGNGQE